MTQGVICVNIQNIRLMETDIHAGMCGIMIGPSRKSAHLGRRSNVRNNGSVERCEVQTDWSDL